MSSSYNFIIASMIFMAILDFTSCKMIDPHSSTRFYVNKSLLNARKLSEKLEHYLTNNPGLSKIATQALQDCSLLAELNIDFLRSTNATLNFQLGDIHDLQIEDVHTRLSAILTNLETCMDGLNGVNFQPKYDMFGPLANDTMLYKDSLALFKQAFSHKKNHSRSINNSNTNSPYKMPKKVSTLIKRASKGRILSDNTDAIDINDIVVVSKDGSGNFTAIMDAVNIAPNSTNATDGYFLIYVNAGFYEEYVSIPKYKRYVMMIGDGIGKTVVTGNRSSVDGYTTFNTATFAVVGEGFVAMNMTFQNTAGASKHQAVALRSGADLSAFYLCSFEGYQDTLYAHSMRQFYRECDIYGTIDFIFGNAAVVLQNCNIYSRLPNMGQTNIITAQGRTDPNQNTGISIQNCRILATDDLSARTALVKTYLGRPWREYSNTVVMETFIDKFIDPAGWLPWSGDFALSTLYYGEFGNTGPGSGTKDRVDWVGYHVINGTIAYGFTVRSFVFGDSWLPRTGVTYSSGL